LGIHQKRQREAAFASGIIASPIAVQDSEGGVVMASALPQPATPFRSDGCRLNAPSQLKQLPKCSVPFLSFQSLWPLTLSFRLTGFRGCVFGHWLIARWPKLNCDV
jgi:hypothetical protein